MNPKKAIHVLVTVIALGTAVLSLSGCNTDEHAEHNHDASAKAQYTCPMHPEVVRSSPGKCPKCNMDLVEKK